MLRNPAVKIYHWKKIMEETGRVSGEINIKTMVLGNVFDLELEHLKDKITEICIEAG